jgi:dihydroorotate dehydrogenase electron transfer subunit
VKVEQARVVSHGEYSGEYRLLVLDCPGVAADVKPGQFVHLRVPRYETAVLRRPFSVFVAEEGEVSILYKCVGGGTRALARVAPDEVVSVLGPLGNGFPPADPAAFPVLVAGGYGVAPLCLFAARSDRKGVAFVGAATERDVLGADEFRRHGWDVRVATEDGSAGRKGLVTDVVEDWLRSPSAPHAPEFFACGPDGMLRAVGDRAIAGGWNAWLSLDKHMGCGVGACLTCVQRIRRPDGSEAWARVCRDGPVFEAREIVWNAGGRP